MPSPDPDPGAAAWLLGGGSANTDLCQLVAAAADLCRKPWRHAVIGPLATGTGLQIRDLARLDSTLKLEVRGPDGERRPEQDLELELYCSGRDLHLTFSWCEGEGPLLWYGSHPVWMDGVSGERCACPDGGAPLEGLARRLRALLV